MPRWGREASTKKRELESLFRENLSRIAVRLAHQDRANSIDAVHVDRAYEALIAAGIDKTHWLYSSKTKLIAAGVLGTIASLCPDFIPYIPVLKDYPTASCWSIVISCCTVSLVFLVAGWLQNRI